MEGINLLPWREEQREEKKKQFIIMLVCALLLGLFTVIISHTLIARQIYKQILIKNYLQDELDHLDLTLQRIKTINAEQQSLQLKLKKIISLKNQGVATVDILAQIANSIPDNVYLTKLSKRNNSLEIQGESSSQASITSFMQNLTKSKWIRKVTVKEINNRDQFSIYNKTFILVAQLVYDH